MQQRIREIREQLGIPQNKLAKDIGVTKSQLSKIENGSAITSIPKLRTLAKALNLKVSDLLVEDDYCLRISEAEKQLLNDYRKVDDRFKKHLLMHFSLMAQTINTVKNYEET